MLFEGRFMDDLFDPRTNLSDPSGGVEVPVFAKSGAGLKQSSRFSKFG
jgi:hypothetical protein